MTIRRKAVTNPGWISRRAFLVGTGVALVRPRPAATQGHGDREHRVEFDLPILSEEPTAVPIRVGVDHPMEPDHFIRSIAVTLDKDPVPYKGTFLFGPANGRAWIAFQMRSGAGGIVRATAECSRHGRFEGTREVRVVEGGCSTPPERGARERLGNPALRLPRSVRAGDIVEVRAKVDHASHTGLTLRNGRFVRESPEFYVKQMAVLFDDQPVCEFRMTSAISPNPLIRFPLKVARGGTLRVVFVNNEEQRWEVAEALRV